MKSRPGSRGVQPSPLALLLLACACHASLDGGDGTFDDRFEVGEAVSTAVASDTAVEIAEPVTGRTFVFPDGGQGTLTVAPITAGPDRPYPGGSGFRVEWTGNERVRIRVPDTDGADYLLGYGVFTGAGNFDAEGGRWVHIPSSEKADGVLTFDLPVVFEAAPVAEWESQTASGQSLVAQPLSRWRGYSYFWLTLVTPTASAAENQALVVATADGFMSNWLMALPAAMRERAVAETSGRLRPRYFYDANYYIGFTRYLWGDTVTPMVGLVVRNEPVDERAGAVAHEVGHYMTHVLVGDERYRVIEDRAPDAGHGILDRWGRGTVTEEYAYFSQYFLLGRVGTADPTNAFAMFGASKRPYPASTDYPGIEGFGCLLLAALHRTEAEVYAIVSGKREPVPVIGASFGEIAGIIAVGAADMDALRAAVEAFLASRGQADRLPALAERIGWSYWGTGTVVDADGKPLSGARLTSISRVGGDEYGMQPGDVATTGPSGAFTLARIFPGPSILRVEAGGSTVDVPIDIAWTLPTDEGVDLETITAVAGGAQDCPVGAACKISVVVASTWDNGMTVGGDVVQTPMVPGTVQGASFRGSLSNASYDLTLSLTLDASCDAITTFAASGSTATGTVRIAGALVPEDSAGSGFGDRRWKLDGSAVCGSVSQVEKTANDGFGTIASWTCADSSALRIECSY